MKKISLIVIAMMSFTCIFNSCENSNDDEKENLTLVDSRDGKEYDIKSYGNQTWMVENLAFKADSGCWAFKNDESKVINHGYLYDWKTACKVCPEGWHLPSDKEWMMLEYEIGMPESDTGKTGNRGYDEFVGTKMSKAYESTKGVEYKNESGFSVGKSGMRKYNGSFTMAEYYSFYWTSTKVDKNYSWKRKFYSFSQGVERSQEFPESGFSIRCVKD